MQKLLYAIQAKPVEGTLSKELASYDIVSTGAVTYREAIIPSLTESQADILVYRESLRGSTETFALMKKIRVEFPQVRVVFISNEQPATSKLLCQLVFLGIYDIINSNNPNINDILDFIVHPRDFGYAAKFFHAENIDELLPKEQPAEPSRAGKKKGFFGIIDKLAGMPETPPNAPVPSTASPQSLPPPKPDVDLETVRGAMLEEARRTAQAEIPQLVSMQVEMETAALKTDLTHQKEIISSLNRDLKEKTNAELALKKQLGELALLKKSAEDQLAKFKQETDLTIQSYEAQLVGLQTTKPPEWYQEQTNKWQAERTALKAEALAHAQTIKELTQQLQDITLEKERLVKALEAKSREAEALQLAVPRDLTSAIDDTLEADFVIIPDSDMEYKLPLSGEGRVIAFMGTKHGVGNTTVALNTAIALSSCGYKTLFIELNRQFPLVNEFFEFSNIVRGLDTAIMSLQQNNPKLAAQCIIKPHGIMTQKKTLSKVYKRLPGPLHFLLYSNDFLLRCKDGTAPYITERELKDLTYFLTMQEHYSYVVVDLQPDDPESLNTFLNSSYHVHQLVLTMTQDPHSITTAGYMITNLARSRNSALIRGAEFVVNQYSSANKMAVGKISDFLHVPANRFSRISLDSKGYMDASFSAVPYLLSKGRYSNEYIDLRMKLAR